MNVIISNKNQGLLANLDIDVIKHLNGEYENINVIQQLSVNFDTSKIILLLDDSEKVNAPLYLSQLVSMGIYNFTKDINAVKFLIDNPNTYKDVAQYHQLNAVDEKPIFNDFTYDNKRGFIGQRVIGFKNLTDGAGSTTLVYMLKNHLAKNYKVKAVEVDGNDFALFGDKSLTSLSSDNLSQFINENSDSEVILVDLNSEANAAVGEIIYLVEPGLIKLNKLVRNNNRVFDELKNQKIVLNRSALTEKDITDFERESGSKIFFNIPNLDDKIDDHEVLYNFLSTLGFSRMGSSGSKGLFSVFK